MQLKKVGIIGWRGMVGSVLLQRMQSENDFNFIQTTFFSTTQAGQDSFVVKNLSNKKLADAHNIDQLAAMDILLSCQGGDYTKEVHPQLMKVGWKGHWIDAASALRMDEDSVLVLDPVNHSVIEKALLQGGKKYIGANCTVSLMLMAINGLLKENLVEWISSMTYQAASGAGAQNMRELLEQMNFIGERTKALVSDPGKSILEIDGAVTQSLNHPNFPQKAFGFPLAGNLLPWIDSALENGQSREEWKGMAETNKIMGLKESQLVKVDGTCVRVGAMRCHSQGLTIKMKSNVPLKEIEDLIRQGNAWVKLIPNNKEETLKYLGPAAVSGTMSIPVGRVRKLNLGPEFLNAFTVGDQLLWGAAEPLRRVLRIIIESM